MAVEPTSRNRTTRRLVLGVWVLICGWLCIGLLVALIRGVFYEDNPAQCGDRIEAAADSAFARCGSTELIKKRRL